MNAIVSVTRDWGIGRNGGLVVRNRADMRFFRETTMGGTVVCGRTTFESFPGGALKGRRNVVLSRNPAYAAQGAEVVATVDDALRMIAGDEAFDVLTVGTSSALAGVLFDDQFGAPAGGTSGAPTVAPAGCRTDDQFGAPTGGTTDDQPDARACGPTDTPDSNPIDAPTDDVWIIGGESVYCALLHKCARAFVTYHDVSVPVDAFFPNLDADATWELEDVLGTGTTDEGIVYEFRVYRNLRPSARSTEHNGSGEVLSAAHVEEPHDRETNAARTDAAGINASTGESCDG